MKKLYILLIITLLNFFTIVNANVSLKNLPSDFKDQCYKFSTKINNNFKQGETYYLNTNKSDILVTQNNKILPIKSLYKTEKQYNNYFIIGNEQFDYRKLKDDNNKTFLELTLGLDNLSGNDLILKFDKKIKEYSNVFNFNFISNYYYPEYYISNDGIKYNKVQKQNITDFSFLYLKIKFKGKAGFNNNSLEKIKIYELYFIKSSNRYMFMSFYDKNITIYSGNNCKNNSNIYPNSFSDFKTDINTKSINVVLLKNKSYNVFIKNDIDKDNILDNKDNCKYIFNPLQKDINGDGIGDLCSDNDKDGIIGYKDNCRYLYNPQQKDINVNGIGDVCEFDKDKDGVFDTVDNCINVVNPNQLDGDKDGIGNSCDNCNLYNPNQLDINKDGIGDVCEVKKDFLLKNDLDKDGIIDSKDNCKQIANPNQFDSDKDGIGNMCDNCLNIQNNNQLDFNNNGVGDICEDSDKDGIQGLIDNCINVANSDQSDINNNGIGDVCEDSDGDAIIASKDNCPLVYNPQQLDIDKDNIGDACDKKDNRYIESNSTFFIGLVILIAIGFLVGIFVLIRKLK